MIWECVKVSHGIGIYLVRLIFCLTLGCFWASVCDTHLIFLKPTLFYNLTLAFKDSVSVKTQVGETEKVRKKKVPSIYTNIALYMYVYSTLHTNDRYPLIASSSTYYCRPYQFLVFYKYYI